MYVIELYVIRLKSYQVVSVNKEWLSSVSEFLYLLFKDKLALCVSVSAILCLEN